MKKTGGENGMKKGKEKKKRKKKIEKNNVQGTSSPVI